VVEQGADDMGWEGTPKPDGADLGPYTESSRLCLSETISQCEYWVGWMIRLEPRRCDGTVELINTLSALISLFNLQPITYHRTLQFV
jgi:hypothetical protein